VTTKTAPPKSGHLSPKTRVFKPQTVGESSAALHFSVGNTGSAELVVSGAEAGGANAADFAVSSQCGTVSPGQSCDIDVTFTPSAKGPRKATITVTTDAPDSPFTATVSGIGRKAAAAK
jgi:hypothetical protein